MGNTYAPLYLELAWCYRSVGNFDDAERVLKKVISFKRQGVRPHAELALLYKEAGRRQEAARYAASVEYWQGLRVRDMTEKNFQVLRVELAKRGIPLLCVQYPMRNINALKK